MVTTYTQFANKSASQKIGLVHIHGKEEVKIFTTASTLHTKSPRAFVLAVELNGTELTSVTSSPTAGQFNYDITTNVLTIFFDGIIADQEVIVTYRFFFSTFPAAVSYDLTDAGTVVDYKPLVRRIPGFATNIEFAKANKTVTGSGALTLDNNDGFFNELIRNVRFDNKLFTSYSWNPDLAFSEHKILYSGITNSANIRGGDFRIGVKDTIFTLNNQVPVTQFTASEVIAAHTGRFKKNIYGRVNGMAMQSISQIGDGYALTGSIAGTSGSNVVNGTSTLFLTELAPRDAFTISGTKYTIAKIINNSTLLLTELLESSISATNPLITPRSPWFNRNRRFSVANHALKKFSTTIAGFVDNRRIQVASASGFESGDNVIINDETYTISAISKIYTNSPTNTITADVIILDRTLSANNFPAIGATIETKEVSNIINVDEALLDNDITVNNTDSSETTIDISSFAEQNVAGDGFFEGVLTSVAGTNYYVSGIPFIESYTLTVPATADFRGTSLRLAKKDDTTSASGQFVWFGNTTALRQFTRTVAATVNFAAGDIYQELDNDFEYFGVQEAGVNQDKINLGTDLPLIIELTDAVASDFDSTSIELKTLLDNNQTEQLFGSTTSSLNWTLATNAGTVGFSNSLVFGTNSNLSSTSVQSTGAVQAIDVSLSESVSPRDLIREATESNFNIIVEAQQTFAQVQTQLIETISGRGIFRNPSYITDTSLLTGSAFGQTEDGTITGTFIKTPSDAVKKILIDNGLTNSINTASFTEASLLELVSIGIYTPYSLRAKAPSVNDFINKCSLSGLGALGLDNNFQLKYILLNGKKPTTLDDVRLIQNNEVINRAREEITPSALFRYTISNIEADYDFGENTPNSTLLRIEDPKISRLTDLNTTETVDLYLRKETDANQIADRFLNYSQKFNRIVEFNGSLGLSDVDIGDVVLLDLLELRENSISSPFIGMITQFRRDGTQIYMSVDDFGGLFVNSANLASDSLGTFANSTSTNKLLGTFLTDDNGLIDNNEDTLGTNLLS